MKTRIVIEHDDVKVLKDSPLWAAIIACTCMDEGASVEVVEIAKHVEEGDEEKQEARKCDLRETKRISP